MKVEFCYDVETNQKGNKSLTITGIEGGVSSNITELNIPEKINVDGEEIKVTEIGDNAFEGCDSLISIKIPSSVTNIGCDAFEDCTSLISINIPSNVIRLGQCAFAGCKNVLDSCEIDREPENWDEGWNWLDKDKIIYEEDEDGNVWGIEDYDGDYVNVVWKKCK